MEWGAEGAKRAATRGDVVVIVDTLRFSTVVAVAVARGASVRIRTGDHAPRWVKDPGTLSPTRYEKVEAGKQVDLWSLNGAMCCAAGKDAPRLFVASFINARAAAAAAESSAVGGDGTISVIACGERTPEPNGDGPIRLAVEDYLGAGAILSSLTGSKSPEARVCQAAFEATHGTLTEILLGSTSGYELRCKGLEEDVRYAAQLHVLDAAPVLDGDTLRAFSPA
jgi:2-phosphosulfolactate phosphatase